MPARVVTSLGRQALARRLARGVVVVTVTAGAA